VAMCWRPMLIGFRLQGAMELLDKNPSSETRSVLQRHHDPWTAKRPIFNLKVGGPSSHCSSELNTSSPTSGSSSEEEEWPADQMLR
jgi:hypothetical protein